jgi:peptidoglycan/LPS O-acetylase OafA/YrhL
MSIAYRKDIDGLRAIAIIPVVLFHLGITGFSGGFVGVDIFFVISGFLITSIILKDIEKGVFSFSHFFERRIRRIFPALITVLLSTLVVGYVLLLYPDDLSELGKSLLAQSVFLSNVFFLRNENYFATPAETLPLLHTWTLSVEEQFYILFPAILFLVLVVFKKKILPVVVTIAVASFLISVYLVDISPGNDFFLPFIPDFWWNGATNQTAGFYLLHSRTWELMAGALVAITAFRVRSRLVSEILSIAGLLAIVYSVTQFSSETSFPGMAALWPVLGSVAIIVSNTETKTVVGRVLSWPWFVFLGLISYSLYLWHWPVIVFSKIIIPEPNTIQTIALIIVPICLAWMTYICVELPFKQKRYFPKRKPLIIGGVSALAVMVILGYVISTKNFDYRMPAFVEPLFEAEKNMGHRYQECLKEKSVEDTIQNGPCLLGLQSETSKPSFILLGDSHAGTIVSTLDNMVLERNITGVSFISPGCLPIIGTYRPDKSETCTQILDLAFAYIQENDIKSVLFVANWNHYLGASEGVYIVDEQSKETSKEESRLVFESGISRILNDMETDGRQVFIMQTIPVQHEYKQRDIFRSSIKAGQLLSVTEITLAQHRLYNAYVDGVFADMTDKYKINLIDPAEILCVEGGECSLYDSAGAFVYSNNDHLNFIGANMLKTQLNIFVESAAEIQR